MKLVQSYLTKNDCYKAGQKISVKGLMLQSVCCPQPSAKVFVNNWNRSGIDRCVHAFIDAYDGTVYQTLPWNRRGLYAGVGTDGESANNSHIGIAMCEPAQIKYGKSMVFSVVGDRDQAIACVKRTYETAIELFADLCVEYMLNPMTAIISRSEGYARGMADKHCDPEHLWKQLDLPYTMDTFRAAVKAKVDAISELNSAPVEMPVVATPEVKLVEMPVVATPEVKPVEMPVVKVEAAPVSVEPVPEVKAAPAPVGFDVRIDVTNLRIRKGPGTNFETTGDYTGKGIFHIDEVQNGNWGKLSNGAGWVMLDYVTRL